MYIPIFDAKICGIHLYTFEIIYPIIMTLLEYSQYESKYAEAIDKYGATKYII